MCMCTYIHMRICGYLQTFLCILYMHFHSNILSRYDFFEDVLEGSLLCLQRMSFDQNALKTVILCNINVI